MSEIIARGATDLRHGGQTNKDLKRKRDRGRVRQGERGRPRKRKNESTTERKERREREREREKGSYYDALSCSGHDDRNGALGPMGNGCQGWCIWPSDDINIA